MSDEDRDLEAKISLLGSWATAFQVVLDQNLIAMTMEELDEYSVSQVRRAISRMVRGSEQIMPGQSAIGRLLQSCDEIRAQDEYKPAPPIPAPRQIAPAPLEPNMSLSEFLARNPDSPLRQFSKAFRDTYRAENPALSEDQIAQKRRAQMRALEEHEHKAGPIADQRKADPIEEVI